MPRLRQGDLVNPSFQRTRLAVAYDTPAAATVSRAIRQFDVREQITGRLERAAATDWIETEVASPAGDPVDRGGLTEHERAFTQAVNHDRRVYRHGPGYTDGVQNPNPARTHAVKVNWTGRYGTRGRIVRVRVFRIGEASVYGEDRREA